MIANRIVQWANRCLRSLNQRMGDAVDAITMHEVAPRMMKPVPVECRWRNRGGDQSGRSRWEGKY